jgi:hypothetical protein
VLVRTSTWTLKAKQSSQWCHLVSSWLARSGSLTMIPELRTRKDYMGDNRQGKGKLDCVNTGVIVMNWEHEKDMTFLERKSERNLSLGLKSLYSRKRLLESLIPNARDE